MHAGEFIYAQFAKKHTQAIRHKFKHTSVSSKAGKDVNANKRLKLGHTVQYMSFSDQVPAPVSSLVASSS